VPTVKCPYCAEEIQANARKCKHCGEWLVKATERPGRGATELGAVYARALAKGLKQAEQVRTAAGCLGLTIMVVAFAAWVYVHWTLGAAVGIGGLALVAAWYRHRRE